MATTVNDIYTQYSQVLTGYLNGFTAASRQSAEDLLQETMIRVWRHWDDLPTEPERIRRWLFVVARNVGIDAIRRTRARPVGVELIDAFPSSNADDITDTVVALESLKAALGSLSLMHQRILTELYFEGRSTHEAAQRLGVPVGTVKSRAFYALQSLRRSMAGPDNERPRTGRPASRPRR
ncbi:putative RNA polymerase ECF-subfamily sigma factor [Actinoplanes missouriensis 431]|uniref:Putative RNA polymerase ECF-subfamily sigma factor n=1 Tax=Actinoplanes missouriensis (strain ATCC 14538 / DSM 43046 / CBS 188.64 / JCM 3121 / NBRC 102363 / NCIMB 12654 / NRRL B-3342 / UNCC 431) TaxID=512565 RepID=I0H472_ACTM4|nr:sigma-70 family RNA polymerase sigma factor [Actinoplanes missouriensis]BAL87809.1 putative RNA polymerase ECF-subfamily sigma factor [Actinoplanes missouriensis 431]